MGDREIVQKPEEIRRSPAWNTVAAGFTCIYIYIMEYIGTAVLLPWQ